MVKQNRLCVIERLVTLVNPLATKPVPGKHMLDKMKWLYSSQTLLLVGSEKGISDIFIVCMFRRFAESTAQKNLYTSITKRLILDGKYCL